MKIGCPHTQKQVLSLVQQMIDHKGIETTVTSGWWERFRLKTAVPLSYVRTDEDTLNRYYNMLEDTLMINKLLHVFSTVMKLDCRSAQRAIDHKSPC